MLTTQVLCTRLLLFYQGSLYGTTVKGGASGVGVIFQLTPPAGHEAVGRKRCDHSFISRWKRQASLLEAGVAQFMADGEFEWPSG